MRFILPLLLILALASRAVAQPATHSSEGDRAAALFKTPPPDVQTAVYWYWISNNMSKEGVVKDLHAMKRAGINRAFIGIIGIPGVPSGKVGFLSEEWWAILHLALKTAADLDIEIGIFNSPGWSQSGGPWVKPEQAMRRLTASELRVSGPLKLVSRLEQPPVQTEGDGVFLQGRRFPAPNKVYEDLRVLAWPVSKGADQTLNPGNSRIATHPQDAAGTIGHLFDGDTQTAIDLSSDLIVTLDLDETAPPFTARSITLCPGKNKIAADVELQARLGDAPYYTTLTRFRIERQNMRLNVGFDPYAPVVEALAPTTARHFRVIFRRVAPGSRLAGMELSNTPRVARHAEKTFAKMHQDALPKWNAYHWPRQAATDQASLELVAADSAVLDITRHLSADGTLTWNVPAGEWRILRVGMTPTSVINLPVPAEAAGYEVDKLSKAHIESHFDAYIGEILRRIPASDRRTFKVVVMDSYETGGQNITDTLLEDFRRRYRYDPVPWLPAAFSHVVRNPADSDRFLWDLRRLIADKIAYDYVGGLRAVSNRHGLVTWLENYGHWGFPAEFLQYGGQSDEVAGEFWSSGSLGSVENRAASSAAHIYGKQRVWSESFTSGEPAFLNHPGRIKRRGDRFFAEGINSTLLHFFIHQPDDEKLPGLNAWFGLEFNRHNTWFTQLDQFTAYLKRTGWLLQQGLNVADIAYFIGEDAPVMTGIQLPPLPPGHQFDYINAEVIEQNLSVAADGQLVLPHGTRYRLLVLPPLETMRPSLLAKIKQLVNDGATIFGPSPSRSPSLENQPAADRQVAQLASELWGDPAARSAAPQVRPYGRGQVMTGLTLQAALDHLGVRPDCELPPGVPVHYAHRSHASAGIDIYFLTNQSDEPQEFTTGFRVVGRQPEHWDPVSGRVRDLPDFTQDDGKTVTRVPLRLAPSESLFVVFRKPAQPPGPSASPAENFPDPRPIAELKGPWTVAFTPPSPAIPAPRAPVVLPELIDWATHPDPTIRHYSGTALYSIRFQHATPPAAGRILLALGEVGVMARVKLNGTDVGGAWTPPWRIDITDAIRSGENRLEIEVVNTWVNRLVGDAGLPKEQRGTWAPKNPWKADSALQKSGLLGPVRIESIAR